MAKVKLFRIEWSEYNRDSEKVRKSGLLAADDIVSQVNYLLNWTQYSCCDITIQFEREEEDEKAIG